MQNLTVFENPAFGTVRTVEVEGEPWLVGKDVAAALGYSNPRDALAKHVDDEDKNTVAICDGTPGNPNQTIINESGLYSLVLSDASCPLATPQSVLPVLCVLFRVWVFSVKRPQNGRITQTTPFPKSTESTGTTQNITPALPKAGEAGVCCGLTKSNVCAILFIEGCRRPNGGSPLSYKK